MRSMKDVRKGFALFSGRFLRNLSVSHANGSCLWGAIYLKAVFGFPESALRVLKRTRISRQWIWGLVRSSDRSLTCVIGLSH